jgi:hypothetical protein
MERTKWPKSKLLELDWVEIADAENQKRVDRIMGEIEGCVMNIFETVNHKTTHRQREMVWERLMYFFEECRKEVGKDLEDETRQN